MEIGDSHQHRLVTFLLGFAHHRYINSLCGLPGAESDYVADLAQEVIVAPIRGAVSGFYSVLHARRERAERAEREYELQRRCPVISLNHAGRVDGQSRRGVIVVNIDAGQIRVGRRNAGRQHTES